MRLPLSLALLVLSALPSRADDAAPLPQGQAQEARPGPAPQLMHLERALMQKQEARDKGELPPEKYQQFVASFRLELDAVVGRIPPSPENKGLRAQILARLGEQERGQALASLEQALSDDSENPTLLVAKGSILYEQRDFQAAAALAQQAWDASGRTDQRAWALLKMSEGRISGVQSDAPSPRLQPASDFARLDWSIPEKHDINPQAMGFIRQTIAARREFDMTATGRYAQAAMNADPKSVTVQKLYGMVQADLSKHADTDAYVEQSISALRAGRTEDPVAWAQKAYDRNPTDDTYGMLQSARLKSAEVAAKRAAEQPAKAPKGTSPILPLLAIFGTGLAAYGGYRVARSKSAWSEQEFDWPQEEERDSERIQQNRHRLKIAAAAVAVSVAVVYGGGWLIRVGGPAVLTMLRGGNTSLQRTLASETGALNPAEAQALKEAATIGSARLIPGFTAVESQVINEAQQIISSPQFSRLQEAYKAGRPVTVNIGGRLIQYEPDMPTSGMSFFEGGGFYIGREAFKSPAELQKTVLHELYRLATTQSSNGVTGKLASAEANAAYTFADRAAGALRR